jgi:hypothetical protein
MTALKSRWKKKGTGEIIHPETEIDQLKNGENALSSVISTLLKAATTANARSAIESAAASHQHASGDITSFATSVINAIGTETLSALGVRYSITTNGYICFGDLFGGLILQWTYDDVEIPSAAVNHTDYLNPITVNSILGWGFGAQIQSVSEWLFSCHYFQGSHKISTVKIGSHSASYPTHAIIYTIMVGK